MTTIVDVAAYILRRYGSMTTMKLQKLAYYSQAEALSRRGTPLFDEDFQAWRGGPVCYDLFLQHRGRFIVDAADLEGNSPHDLSSEDATLVDRVCDGLSSCTGNQLSERTHGEDPWRRMREGLAPSDQGSRIISKDAIRRFYRANPVFGSAACS
ncbi:MAG: DUF4065 domain-containing protein [Bifidobacterium minimum]|jgi:uncharacterized phage-associated protein|nr:DUF4065 domain-containing protein [Bifidobacterium minimum]